MNSITKHINKTMNNIFNNKIAFSLFLLLLASAETGAMSLFKSPNYNLVITGFIAYMGVTMALVYLVRSRGLAVGHALFDVSSIIIATLVGIFALGEPTNTKQNIGLLLAIISVILLQ